MAEALLLSDKLNESIDHLNMNTRIDSDSDILFFDRTTAASELDGGESSTGKQKSESNRNLISRNSIGVLIFTIIKLKSQKR